MKINKSIILFFFGVVFCIDYNNNIYTLSSSSRNSALGSIRIDDNNISSIFDAPLTITDSNNCQYQGQAIITEPDPISVNEFITNVSCFGLSDGVVLLQINGGTAPYNQDWSGNNPLTLAQGNYGYTITDTNSRLSIRLSIT